MRCESGGRPLAVQPRPAPRSLAFWQALYRRVYRVIGVVVAALGSALVPFLPVLIRELPDIPHLDLIYLQTTMVSRLASPRVMRSQGMLQSIKISCIPFSEQTALAIMGIRLPSWASVCPGSG